MENQTSNDNLRRRPARTVELLISSIVIMITLVGGLLWARAELENHATRITRTEADIKKLDESVAHSSDSQFTAKEGDALENRVNRLELWTQSAPPLWFREMFKEFKSDVKDEIATLKNQLISIQIGLSEKEEKKDRKN